MYNITKNKLVKGVIMTTCKEYITSRWQEFSVQWNSLEEIPKQDDCVQKTAAAVVNAFISLANCFVSFHNWIFTKEVNVQERKSQDSTDDFGFIFAETKDDISEYAPHQNYLTTPSYPNPASENSTVNPKSNDGEPSQDLFNNLTPQYLLNLPSLPVGDNRHQW